jgi:nucleoid-associated protein YgaU
MLRVSRRRTAAAIALTVPLALLSATPAQAQTGSGEITNCKLERDGDVTLTATVQIHNTDQNNNHSYTVDIQYSRGDETLGKGEGSVNVDSGLTEKTDVSASSVSSTAQDQPNGPLTCTATSAEDDNGMSIDVKSFPPETQPPNEDHSNGAPEYTVVSGDTLSGIAESQLGNASEWTKIYDLNRDVIESTAHDHGLASSGHGHWIFPGTVLKLPQ